MLVAEEYHTKSKSTMSEGQMLYTQSDSNPDGQGQENRGRYAQGRSGHGPSLTTLVGHACSNNETRSPPMEVAHHLFINCHALEGQLEDDPFICIQVCLA